LFVGSSETGALLNRDFVSTGLSMAFAFRRRTAEERRARIEAIIPTRPKPARPRVTIAPPPPVAAAPIRRPPLNAAPSDPIDEASRLADQGRFAQAAALCEASLRQHGPSARAFYLLGVVRDAGGNLADAEALYRKAIYLDPGHREALMHL